MQDTQPCDSTGSCEPALEVAFRASACAIIFRQAPLQAKKAEPSAGNWCDGADLEFPRARPPRCHRPQDPEGAAGRRPHDQCGAGAPGRHLGAALPAARARARGGRLHQGLSRRCSTRSCSATRSPSSPWCTCRARPRADLAAFEDFVRAQPLVRECWMLSGEIDFILKCVAPDLQDLPGLRRRAHRRARMCATSRRR